MIRTVLKLAFVALLANAAWHMVGAYWPYYKFKDGVQYAAEYRGDSSDEALRAKILELASQFEVPVADADVSVTHEEGRTIVRLSYVQPVDLAPGFRYSWPFTVLVDTSTVTPLRPQNLDLPK